jgi:hypothetical protein
MTVRQRAASGLAALLLMAVAVAPVRAQEVVHGADSLFVTPAVKIAWAVQKGATDEATAVVIRIVNNAGAYRHVRLDAVDPFSKSRKVLIPAKPLGEHIDLSVPRAGFAEFPSCEIQLYRRAEAPFADQAPNLTVYYLGVPDTTPEFPTPQAMEAYFAKMLGPAK